MKHGHAAGWHAEEVTDELLRRRAFLRAVGSVGLTIATGNVFARELRSSGSIERRLRFHNVHTDESVNAAYFVDGRYVVEERAAIDRVLRDHRNDQIHPIDVKLLDTLWHLQQRLDVGGRPFLIISGYRSPHTNAMLRQRGSGVAKKSMHLEGKAVDIRLQNRKSSQLYKAAVGLKAGGAGYYEKSNFVHVDVGRVRRWWG